MRLPVANYLNIVRLQPHLSYFIYYCRGIHDLQSKIQFQGQNDHQFVIVDSAIDGKTQEEVRLLEPLVIKVVQQPVTLAYPFKYLFVGTFKDISIIISKNSFGVVRAFTLSTFVQITCLTF